MHSGLSNVGMPSSAMQSALCNPDDSRLGYASLGKSRQVSGKLGESRQVKASGSDTRQKTWRHRVIFFQVKQGSPGASAV